MSPPDEPLDFHAAAAYKDAERERLAADIRAGQKSPERMVAEYQPIAQLARRAVIRLDLARRLS